MSSIIEATLGAIIGDKIAEKLKPIIDLGKDRTVIVKSDSQKLVKCELHRISASTVRTAYDITNPVDETCNITNISIEPDDSFKATGYLKISVRDSELFETKTSNSFQDVKGALDINLRPEGKEIGRSEKVSIFAIGSGAVTIYIQFERTRVN